MFTYQIIIEYLGTSFVGWQFQKNGLSIQEVLEKALSKFLKHKVKVIGSGRTDSGVHANGQSAHFKIKIKLKIKILSLTQLIFFLKRHAISIISIKKKIKKISCKT